MIPGVSKDQEALLISLRRPIIFVLPAAFDKGFFIYSFGRLWHHLKQFLETLRVTLSFSKLAHSDTCF